MWDWSGSASGNMLWDRGQFEINRALHPYGTSRGTIRPEVVPKHTFSESANATQKNVMPYFCSWNRCFGSGAGNFRFRKSRFGLRNGGPEPVFFESKTFLINLKASKCFFSKFYNKAYSVMQQLITHIVSTYKIIIGMWVDSRRLSIRQLLVLC